MKSNQKWAILALVGAWSAGGAVVVACGGGDDTSATNVPEAGADAVPTSTATSTGTVPVADTGPPFDSGQTDSGQLDAGARAIWAFNNYCGGPDSGLGGHAVCADTLADCPSFDGGAGVAAHECATPFTRCLKRSPADAGLADKIFLCSPVSVPYWEVNRLCGYEGCDSIDAGTCNDGGGEGGVAGRECAPVKSRCISANDKRVFICQPSGGLVNQFNGYCDAGDGTPACNTEADACAPGGAGGEACTPEFSRCIAGGDKVFVCAQH